eukprot:CAMPEP_0179094204 /NCGR_PEP_ID=MMETSP0796-20121207/43190_1 /TAXON_ID=73915 /ORGANISM="Pyrodinium bahamense, Strain pbaha01" /LENGTH=247 /DNA_ID=CAMNT_0020791869 /DNA_START=80 /DNA_END=823 /DNA_ORIENTATION=-
MGGTRRTSVASAADKRHNSTRSAKSGSGSSKDGAGAASSQGMAPSLYQKNAKGGILVKREAVQRGWQFLDDCLAETPAPTARREPPESLPVPGIYKVMHQMIPSQCSMFKEAQWIMNCTPKDEEVKLRDLYDAMKDNMEEGDPVKEAFNLIRKHHVTKGDYVDVEKVCAIYKALGVEGINPKFMQEVINEVVMHHEDSDNKGKRRITLDTFRRLSAFPPEDEDDVGGHGQPMDHVESIRRLNYEDGA